MIKKIVVVSLSMLYVHVVMPMEVQKKSKQDGFVGLENNSPADYYSYIAQGVNTFSGLFNSSLTSATNTLATTISETRRFHKLGWPPQDLSAIAELKETNITYDQVAKIIKNKQFGPDMIEVLARFDRRVMYALEFSRTFLLFPDHPEGLERARHTLKNHSHVLPRYYQQLIIGYLEKRRDTSMSISVGLDQDLKKFKSKIVGSDDEKDENV